MKLLKTLPFLKSLPENNKIENKQYSSTLLSPFQYSILAIIFCYGINILAVWYCSFVTN